MGPPLAANGFVVELVKISRPMGGEPGGRIGQLGAALSIGLGFLVERGAFARGCAQSSTTYWTYRRVFG
jgi:hypothetical protein